MYKIYSIHFSPKISLIVQQKKNLPEKCHLLLNETIFFCEKTMDIVKSFHFSILPKNSSLLSDIMSHEETILVKKIQPKKEKEKKLLLIFHFQKLSFNSEISSMCGRRKKSFHLNHFHSIPFRAELAKRRFEGNNNERPSLVLVFYRCSIIFDKKLLFMNME